MFDNNSVVAESGERDEPTWDCDRLVRSKSPDTTGCAEYHQGSGHLLPGGCLLLAQPRPQHQRRCLRPCSKLKQWYSFKQIGAYYLKTLQKE